jgi:hypothetical protein
MSGVEYGHGGELLGATEVPAVLGAMTLRELRKTWHPGEVFTEFFQPEIPKPDPHSTTEKYFGDDQSVVD